MVQSLLKSLFLYSALVASAILAAPAHQHESKPLARVSPREYLDSPHPVAAGLNAPIPATIGKRSKERGGRVKKVTNAMRLANGLPPLAPRKLYDGSRVASAHKARSSPLPLMTLPAILVYDANGRSGNLLGYLSQSMTGNFYSITTDCKQALKNGQLFAGDLTNPVSSCWT
ncbi:hypothetical protein M407DRAFT_27865 [Tulasnella calospora MUT 4182]|uniref:Uncharacterized protein n=1 Tax=Tulasnella calospora MUT 4182 TaxID=1051891 RepID=A0A0C3KMK5_9AGAM|nr:hypothetical protein M407DRAFT_27865 [Tulasnella calospora MUT 4182]